MDDVTIKFEDAVRLMDTHRMFMEHTIDLAYQANARGEGNVFRMLRQSLAKDEELAERLRTAVED